VSEIGYGFMKLGISSEDLYNLILIGLDLMKSIPGAGKANPKLRVKLP
jgi:hypothetical protein